MKDYFLDTSFLVDLTNEQKNAIQKHEDIKGHEVTGTPCLYELSKYSQFDPSDLFHDKEVLVFTAQDAKAAGDIYRKQNKEGKKLPEIDTIIAGMVKNRNLVLVTRDSDFQRIKEIELETY